VRLIPHGLSLGLIRASLELGILNMPSIDVITQDELFSALDYKAETGIFTWKYRRGIAKQGNTMCAGKQAGTVSNRGYVIIFLSGKSYRAHRLAYLWMTGSFPENEIDHINRIRDDNRWVNLRPCTRLENQKNKDPKSSSKSGFAGVYWYKKSKKWTAIIKIKKTKIYLGVFDTPEQAFEVYLFAQHKLDSFQNIETLPSLTWPPSRQGALKSPRLSS
jgi:HNH endonuclease/AP2 domain